MSLDVKVRYVKRADWKSNSEDMGASTSEKSFPIGCLVEWQRKCVAPFYPFAV